MPRVPFPRLFTRARSLRYLQYLFHNQYLANSFKTQNSIRFLPLLRMRDPLTAPLHLYPLALVACANTPPFW